MSKPDTRVFVPIHQDQEFQITVLGSYTDFDRAFEECEEHARDNGILPRLGMLTKYELEGKDKTLRIFEADMDNHYIIKETRLDD